MNLTNIIAITLPSSALFGTMLWASKWYKQLRSRRNISESSNNCKEYKAEDDYLPTFQKIQMDSQLKSKTKRISNMIMADQIEVKMINLEVGEASFRFQKK